jgi:hypothetical protein
MIKKLLPVLILLFPLVLSAQKYKTRTFSQFRYDDSTHVLTIETEHYDDKGRVLTKAYLKTNNSIDPEEEGDEQGTRVFYTYSDSLLKLEERFRGHEFEDTAITEHTYNKKGQRVMTVIRRHERFGTPVADTGSDPSVTWKWLNDTITYKYNNAGQLIAQTGGEQWHTISYPGQLGSSRDIVYTDASRLKEKSYIIIYSQYSNDKLLVKKMRDYFNKGVKYLNRTIDYTYTNGKLTKMHSTATSFSKKKSDDAKFENMRFDKKYYYDKQGRLIREETWDPEGFKLVTNLYSYK